MRIELAKTAGFCYGVQRAVELASQAARSRPSCYCLGPLIHNRHMVEHLASLGVTTVETPEQIPLGATAILRSHGVTPDVLARLQDRNVVDATCPFVARIHRLVARYPFSVIVGDARHPEVEGITARCASFAVVENEQSLREMMERGLFEGFERVCLAAQTTMNRTVWEKCAEIAKKLCTNVEIFDTICEATHLRQQEAEALAKRCGRMVVAGDPASANTRQLAAICRRYCPDVILVSQEIPDMPLTNQTVGITAGASTPPWVIKEVYRTMLEEMEKREERIEETASAPGSEPVESFEQMLEHSLKTLTTGDKVTGVITAITPTEIHVDLGTKHAGFIPVGEISDDPEVKVEDMIHVGDEIETYVLRVNDVEGTAMLSKKRLDTVQSWEDVENARVDHTVLEGIVTEENKGGVVVSIKGVRVFVPASQTGLPKDAPMSELLKKKVKLRVTEVNRARRRVVGSIRSVTVETRRALAEKLWESIEVGNVYQGVVKSMTSYGAFVDIGGVDGMVHVSELSWERIREPANILKVGDPLEVHVLSFDKEKKKISLGHKKEADNPWNVFLRTYKVGDVAHVTVIKLMTFGAFCRVLPGVDGLVHISQLADRRVGKPSDVVKEGDEVDVRIMEIDLEKKKISLSIRSLLEEQARLEEQEGYQPDEIVASSEEE